MNPNLRVAYMSHFDKLVRLPEGFVVVAKTANSEFAGIAHQTKPVFGTYTFTFLCLLTFCKNLALTCEGNRCTIPPRARTRTSTCPHFDPQLLAVSLTYLQLQTPRGSELLRNFSVDICGAVPNWVMSDFIEQEITRIRKLVGDTAQVIGGVSGGVDSTVAAKLMKEAIGMAPTVALSKHV